MRRIAFLSLILFLTAWASPGHADTGRNSVAKTRPRPSPQPTLGSSVLLVAWNTAERRYELRPVDPATGQLVPGYSPILLGRQSPLTALSADGRKLAVIESRGQACESIGGGSACQASADVVHLMDLATWQEVAVAPLPGRGWVWPLTLSPDTRYLSMAFHDRASSTLMLFDAVTGSMVAQLPLAFRPDLMNFTRDGTGLVLYGAPLGSPPGIGQPGSPSVLWLTAPSLDVQWEVTLANVASGTWCVDKCEQLHEGSYVSWEPAVVPSHDGRRLYIVHADEDRLTTVDFDAREVRSVAIRAPQPWFERLLALTAGMAEAKYWPDGAAKSAALSSDRTRLYVLGRAMSRLPDAAGENQTPLGLQVVDVESGAQLERRFSEAFEIRTTAGAGPVLMNGWGDGDYWTELFDVSHLRSVARLTGWWVVASRRLDGQPILLASKSTQYNTHLGLLDPQTLEVTHFWKVNSQTWWAMSP